MMRRWMNGFIAMLLLLPFSNLAEAALKLEEIVIDPMTLPADCQARVPSKEEAGGADLPGEFPYVTSDKEFIASMSGLVFGEEMDFSKVEKALFAGYVDWDDVSKEIGIWGWQFHNSQEAEAALQKALQFQNPFVDEEGKKGLARKDNILFFLWFDSTVSDACMQAFRKRVPTT